MGYFQEYKIFRRFPMKRNPEEILSLESLRIGYFSGKAEKVLLPPLNARARTGELIAVIGRNGIGKSTLLRTLTGLQKPLGGNIYYNGRNIRDYSRMELAQEVGYISTEIVRVSNMSVYDLVSLGRFPHTNWIGKIEDEDNAAIEDAIEKTSMTHLSGKFVSELSDGERQKAMIARILAQDSGIMVMDEPTAFLDIAGKYEIFHLLHRLSINNNKTIIYSTHDLQMAISQSDKIWLILDDNLIEGAPEDLMLSGAFDHLFNSSSVQFNSSDGLFSFRGDARGSIFISGEGDKRYWTEKSINRAGYKVSANETSPFIIIPSENDKMWQLVASDGTKSCNTIYELIAELNLVMGIAI
jgi:iron complex transport system ATP-binding protein